MTDRNIGYLIKPFYKQINNALIGLTVISKNDQAELYHSTMFGTKEDPKYFLATKEKFLIEFGVAGMIKTVTKKTNKNYQLILKRNGRGDYEFKEYDDEDSTQINLKENTEKLEQLINYAYKKVGALPNDKLSVIKKKFRNYNANRVIARFKDFRRLVNYKGIIPDFDEHQVPVVTTMDGCPKRCVYCPIGGSVKVYSKYKIKKNIQLAKEILEKYHKPIISDIYEGFINTSDILWHKILKSEVDPLEIVALYKKAFPNVLNLGTFFGVDNILRVGSKYLKGLMYNLGAKNKEDRGFGKGITRGYIGIETAHPQGSRLLGKNHSFEDKKNAILTLKKASIGVKVIIQVGVFGKGFYEKEEDVGKKDKFISSKETLDKTIKLILETTPYRVMLSKFTNLDNLPIENLIKSGQIVSYDNSSDVDNEIDYISEKIKKAHKKGDVKWQGQNWKHPDYEPPIEFDYEDYVKGRKKVA